LLTLRTDVSHIIGKPMKVMSFNENTTSDPTGL
jgi:hypothetical protein